MSRVLDYRSRLNMPPARSLLRQLLVLSAPVLAEQVLHMIVGLNDTYLANHLYAGTPADAMQAAVWRRHSTAAAAAVGTIAYFLWLMGLIVASVGTGATAIIARAVGARHRSLANSVCGQSVTTSVIMGLVAGVVIFLAAAPLADMTRLSGEAHDFALSYLRMLCISLPFMMLMLAANACLRGAGDTLTPAISMIVVDLVNILFTFTLTRGWFGIPAMGFQGIAAGTVIAYIVGGILQFAVLVRGRGGIRLYLHRLRPHWLTLKRLLRIGVPAGMESLLSWLANFAVIIVVNQMDPSNAMAAAHVNTIRVESISFLTGFAAATAAATMVGQSLGMKDPRRAARSAWLAYAVGGGAMTLIGILFILFGEYPARWMAGANNPEVARMTTQCLFITGFIQSGFAAWLIFSGALRGAGDTVSVMFLGLITVMTVRLFGVVIVGLYLNMGVAGVWMVLAGELFLRGMLAMLRFMQGRWRHVKV